jgi:leucyl/phenylalanyl-tRNA--protein transferase
MGGQPVTAEMLLAAYAQGVFPMAETRDGTELSWFDPLRRGIIPLNAFHIPKSLAKRLKRGDFAFTVDQDFAAVIQACAEPRPGHPETWINGEIERLFLELFSLGYAHSVETRDRDGTLIGGLYGLALGGAFFGESMFSRATDASKAALAHLVNALNSAGFSLLDTQFLTPHLARFGAMEISRAAYRARLADALASRCIFPSGPIPTFATRRGKLVGKCRDQQDH